MFVSGWVFLSLCCDWIISHDVMSHTHSWANMYIFIVGRWGWCECGAQLCKAQRSDSKTGDSVASGWGRVTHCLTVSWLLRTQWLLNLRGVEAWTPARPPLSENAWIPFTLSHSAALREGARRKEECSGERKVSESCQSGVRGQRSARRGYVRC